MAGRAGAGGGGFSSQRSVQRDAGKGAAALAAGGPWPEAERLEAVKASIAMSNRATRRADLADFKRDAREAYLVTFLIDASDGVSLDRHPLLRRALEFWRGNIMQRRPFCPACKSNYA